MTLTVFDSEVLSNCFLVCLYDTRKEKYYSYEISERVNQYKEMVKHFTTPNVCFVGFNSLSYDSPIMNYLIDSYSKYVHASYKVIASDCFNISDDIINGEGRSVKHLRYRQHFKQIDLLTMLFSKALRVSLKEMEITMCYRTVQEMSHHWSEALPTEKLDELKEYCFNDVGATSKLLGLCLNDLRLRMVIEQEFDISCLSKDGVGIGVEIFTKFICEDMQISKGQLHNLVQTPSRIAIKDLIVPIIKFRTPKFQEMLKWFKSINISTGDALSEIDGEPTDEKKKYKKKVLLGNTVHTFALGGIECVLLYSNE